jgi:predicted DNA-binding mobile mystery protein A
MALGMSTTELAKRLGTSPSTVSRNETHEAQGVVTLGTLKKAAEAMNCDVVYALVPREKLSDTVMREARRKATERLTATQNTMALEDQAVDQAVLASLIENEAQILSLSPGLWKTNPPNG